MKKALAHSKRIVIVLVAVPIIIVGLILIPLPGPGVLITLVGLSILGLEFDAPREFAETIRSKIARAIDGVSDGTGNDTDKK